MSSDPYDVLGVSPDADLETIKAQYRRLVRENHPDIAPDKADANARMVVILEAWRVLSDTEKRSRLDDDRRTAHMRHSSPVVPAPAPVVPMPQYRPGSSRRPSRSSPRSSSKAYSVRTRLLEQVNDAATLYFREGRADDAISLCQRVLKADAKNFEATVLMGDIFNAQGRADKALVMYERAQLLQPTNILVRRKREALRPSPPPAWKPPQPQEPAAQAPAQASAQASADQAAADQAAAAPINQKREPRPAQPRVQEPRAEERAGFLGKLRARLGGRA